jgi:hypothetical protein
VECPDTVPIWDLILPLQQKILQGILNTENESKQNRERKGSTKPQKKKRQESKK